MLFNIFVFGYIIWVVVNSGGKNVIFHFLEDMVPVTQH